MSSSLNPLKASEKAWRRRARGCLLFVFLFSYSWLVVNSLVAYQFQHKVQGVKVNEQQISAPLFKAYNKQIHWQGEKYRKEKVEFIKLRDKYSTIRSEVSELRKQSELNFADPNKKDKYLNRNTTREDEWCALVKRVNDVNAAEIEWAELENETAKQFRFTAGNPVDQPTKTNKPQIATSEDLTEEKNDSAKTEAQKLSVAPSDNDQASEQALEPDSECKIIKYNMVQFPTPPSIHPEIITHYSDYNYLSHFENELEEVRSKKGEPISIIQTIWRTIINVLYSINFIDMPGQMLVLIVVLSMGALGGTISLARDYLDKTKPIVSWDSFFFQPFLGAVTAFAVYILAKAGVLIIADFGSSGEASINPYFISFIGLVSGMLSENALETIKNVGLRWFKGAEEGKKRYWVGDTELKLMDQKQSPEPSLKDNSKTKLKQHLEDETRVNINIIENWLSGKVLVSPYVQRLIAAWMRMPRRELFTDLAPPEAKTNATHADIPVEV